MKNSILFLLLVMLSSCEPEPEVIGEEIFTPQASGDCAVKEIVETTEHLNYSPDGSKYLISKEDNNGVFQIYIGNTGDSELTCISNFDAPGNAGGLLRSWDERHKVMVQWHASGDFIICGVEKEFYNELAFTPDDLLLGWIQSGLWLDIWALKPDGSEWFLLAPLVKGMTGPAFTPDGSTAVYADAEDGSDLTVDVFGKWRFRQVDFVIESGVPSFKNSEDISPDGARWLEPGNFGPEGRLLLFNSDIGMENAEGQDQYILDITNGEVTNLTNSPEVWDEHGVFSKNGEKILFMSSYPYRDDPDSYKTLSIKTEFMIMNKDGSEMEQLTHFKESGFPESHEGIASTGYFNEDGSKIFAHSLIFPDYKNWVIHLEGNCGY